MTRHRLAVMGLVLGGIFLVAALAWAVASNGPYYAMPAWDQKLPASTRFVVLLDWNSEAVLDRETGLVWEKTPTTGVLLWNPGQCLIRLSGGRKGWRLPSAPELASLIDPSVAAPGPTLPPGHPFINVQVTDYWSATTNATSSDLAYVVNFMNGGTGSSHNKDSFSHPFWCVRGPMQESVY
jgi:hypothetical protein